MQYVDIIHDVTDKLILHWQFYPQHMETDNIYVVLGIPYHKERPTTFTEVDRFILNTYNKPSDRALAFSCFGSDVGNYMFSHGYCGC